MSLPGKEVFRCYDNFGPIKVYDDGNKRYLSFGLDDEQSCQLKSAPDQLQYDYTRAMLIATQLVHNPRKILMFGLGGASLPCCLHQHFPSAEIDVIELRQRVIDVAFRYFQLPRSPRLKVIEQDARDYLREQETRAATEAVEPNLDIIYSDIYSAEGPDDMQLTDIFLQQCKGLLQDAGWLVLNLWTAQRKDRDFIPLLQQYFADIRVCNTQSNNWVVMAGKRPNTLSDKELREKIKQLGQQVEFGLLGVYSRLQRCRR